MNLKFWGVILVFSCLIGSAIAKPIAVVRCVPYSQYDADHLTMKILNPAGKSYEILTNESEILVASNNSCIKIAVSEIPTLSTGAAGSRSIKLSPNSNIVGISKS